MADHHELVAEMPILEQMGTQERQKLAKKRRNQQLKRWNQREKEWLAKEKQLNKRLANKISEENNGLNLKQYTTYSSNHRSKKNININKASTTTTTATVATTTTTTPASATGVNIQTNNNNNNNIFHKNNNESGLTTISRFSQVNSNGPKTIGLAPNGRVHFNVGVMLLEAAARNDYDEVKRLLMLGVSPDSVNHDGLTALHQCCIDASEPIMSLLLEFGANVDARDTEQWTPLHAACTCGHLNLVTILVENGANLLAVNGDGNMPFDICEDEATLDYIETQMVERGITQEMIDQTRASTEMQMMADLEKKIASGTAENLNEPLENGATPLHIAAANGYQSVVQYLIENGVDVNVCDNDRWTPLHGVACWGNEQHSKVVELLVEAGAHLDLKTSNDETVFDLCDNTELLEKLNQLKDELASKQAASNTDLLKRTQSKTNSRIHSVRRTSVRDKNQISRREAREEAMLRVDSNTVITGNSLDQSPQQQQVIQADLKNENGISDDSPNNISGGDVNSIELNGSDRPDGISSVSKVHHDNTGDNLCKQTNLDIFMPDESSHQQLDQNGLTFEPLANGSSESMRSRVSTGRNHHINDISAQREMINRNNAGTVDSLSSDKLSNQQRKETDHQPSSQNVSKNSKNNMTFSSTKQITMSTNNIPQAQENDSHDSNNTACDQMQDHHFESAPILIPFSYTLSNLKKQRSDLRMRTTTIGGSTTTIIVSTNSNGSVSLNPKMTNDDHDSPDVDELRTRSPSATIRKFSGEPSEVIGEDKRESRHNCCIII